MRFCTSCGYQLGVGRFCTNCGHPIDASTPRPSASPSPGAVPSADTAERRAARRSLAMEPAPPRIPPSAADPPPAPRFPLFADEVGPEFTTRGAAASHRSDASDEDTSGGAHRLGDRGAPGSWDTGTLALSEGGRAGGASLLERLSGPRVPDEPHRARTAEEALAALDAAAQADDGEHHNDVRRRRRPWLVGVLLLAMAAAVLGGWLATRGSGDDPAADPSGAGSPAGAAGAQGRDVAAEATVQAPGNAAPATEVGGARATFAAANMLDGDPSTTWRVAGDARGKKIVFTLAEKTTISQVGLINGYAKTATDAAGRKLDPYQRNRTITKVAWVFDDQTVVEQSLARERTLQTIAIDDVATSTITLRLLEVAKPGRGRAARDFTAISEVSLIGTPAS